MREMQRKIIAMITVCVIGLAANSSGYAETSSGRYSRSFLEGLNEECWFGSSPIQRKGKPARGLVSLTLHNPGGSDRFQICVYDLACGDVVFAGQIHRRSRQYVRVCPDSRGRGHILILDTLGNYDERRGLKSPATITLSSSSGLTATAGSFLDINGTSIPSLMS